MSKDFVREIALVVVLVAFLLLSMLLFPGCTSPRVAGPSTRAVQAHVATARTANTEAIRYNDITRTTAQRIEAKAAVLDKYWK